MKSDRRSALVWPCLVTLVFTLVMLQWSFNRFRLTSAPFPDDVSWFNDGIGMLDSMRDGGILGLLRHISESGTLQPYSIVAAVGFGLFGIVDWAPYLMNGWLIFSLLLFLEIARQRERLPLRAWLLGVAIALSFPCCGYSIVSFVGDHSTGMFLAIGAIAFLQNWPAGESVLESWTGTLAWVFAFYGKATLFPETILVLLVSAVIGCGIAVHELPEKTGARYALFRRWASRSVVVPLLALPYYSVVWRVLYNYLYLNNYGALRKIWIFSGTASESLLYYVTGFSGGAILGPAVYFALALVLIRLALLFSEGAAEKLRFAGLMLVIAITYAMPTFVANKTPLVASPFQFLVVLTAVMCYWAIRKRIQRRLGVMELLVCGIVLLVARFPDRLDRRDTPAVLERDRTMAGLIRTLELEDVKKDEPVFLTTIGYVGVTTLRYEFLKHHFPMPRFFDLALSDKPSEFPAMIDQAAFVIATDPGNDEVFYTAPSAFIQAETLAMVQRNPAFIEVSRFNTWRGKRYYLFGRRTRTKPVDGPPAADIPAPGPVLLYGISAGAPGDWRWSRREFAIEFPAPRGLRAELKLRLILPQANIEKLGPVTLEADIPQEGRHSETFANGGAHEFTYRYTIRKHLISTVVVRFRLNKALPAPQGSGDELGLLFGSAEVNPIGDLREGSTP